MIFEDPGVRNARLSLASYCVLLIFSTIIIALLILHEALDVIFKRDSRLTRVLLDLAIFPLPLLKVITANI